MSMSSNNPMFQTFRESRRKKMEKDLADFNDEKYQAKEEFDTLKILSLLNNTKYHQVGDFVFSKNIVKEYTENIAKIKTHKEKLKKSYESIMGIALMNNSQHLTIEQRRRAHELLLTDAVQLCLQNRDIAINIFTCAANKLKDRVCTITRALEKWHCRGFVSMHLLAEACGFVKVLHGSINNMLNKPKDNSISFLNSAFSSKCKLVDKSCPSGDNKYDTKCTDSNEILIRNVLYEYLDNDFEIPDFRKTYTQRYCYFLAKENQSLLRKYLDTLDEMKHINEANEGKIFIPRTRLEGEGEEVKEREESVFFGAGSRGVDEDDLEYNHDEAPSEIVIPVIDNQSFIPDEDISDKMQGLEMYHDIKRAFMGYLEKADDSSIKFVEEYLIQFIPHVIHEKQTVNRKALYIYQKFYDYSIWILAYGMLITLVDEMNLKSDCGITEFTAQLKSEKKYKKKCKDEYLSFKFPYTIFKTYFKEYIVPEEGDDLAEDASGTPLDEEARKVGEEGAVGGADFGLSNFFGFGKKK